MSKVLVIYAVAALAETFRRANTTFTTAGTAYPQDYFTKQQLTAIHAEKRLSVREVDVSDVPETVNTQLLAVSATTEADKKEPPQKSQSDTATAETLEQAFALLDPSNKDHFTGSGVPQLDVLSRLLARNVKSAERDVAWAEYVAMQSAEQQQAAN